MKQNLSFAKIVFTLALTAIIFSFLAFRQTSKSEGDSFRKEQKTSDNDTTTSGKRNRNGAYRHFDKIEEQMKQLELQMEKLGDQMQKLDGQLQKIDMTKYENEINKALQDINLKEIENEVSEPTTEIEPGEINESIERIKVDKLRMKEVEKELEKAKRELHKQKFEMDLNKGKMRLEVKEAMQKAKQSLRSAHEEIENIKNFTDALQKDGLIDKSKAYKIEVKDGELFIDGKKQSKETSDKYRKYYKKSDFSINMSEGDDFRI